MLKMLTTTATATLVVAGTGWGQWVGTEETKITLGDPVANQFFGYSVFLSGDTALVGAVNDKNMGIATGSAYVFVGTGTSWTQQAKLAASDGAASDSFGHSVSLSGDTALVGARYDDDNGTSSGSAYVFRRNGTAWVEEAKLTAADGAAFDYFGTSVSLSGDTALVGASGDDGSNGDESGSAYVFVRSGTTWTLEAKLATSDGVENDSFGGSVFLSGDNALVGAQGGNLTSTGSAYVFARSGTTWTEEAKLTASDGSVGDALGTSVCLSGDTALVGADGEDDNGNLSGSAYVFVRNGSIWVEEAKLLAADGAASDRFGTSVSLSGDTALVGASDDDDNGNASGSVYVFARSGTNWTEETKLTASDGSIGDRFGSSVSLSGATALVGALDDASSSGSVYLFEPPPPTVYCTAGISASGCRLRSAPRASRARRLRPASPSSPRVSRGRRTACFSSARTASRPTPGATALATNAWYRRLCAHRS